MKVDLKTANKVWNAYFGNEIEVEDPFGEIMHKNLHGSNKKGGWEVDHIWPLNAENGTSGANTYSNVQPLASYSNETKGNQLQGKINEITFAIKKIEVLENGERVGKMLIKIDDEWEWAYEDPHY